MLSRPYEVAVSMAATYFRICLHLTARSKIYVY
jgi:hypothetical protein